MVTEPGILSAMGNKRVPFISVVGKRNVGKTTLIEGLLPLLKAEGLKVGVMKYDVRTFQIDYEGKDTYRYYQSGADAVLISSPKKLALIKKMNSTPPMEELLHTHFADTDLVILEGYKNHGPKIFLLEPGEGNPHEVGEDGLVLKVTQGGGKRGFSLREVQAALDFIRKHVKKDA